MPVQALVKHQHEMLRQLLGPMDGKVSPSSVMVTSKDPPPPHFAEPPPPRSWECSLKQLEWPGMG